MWESTGGDRDPTSVRPVRSVLITVGEDADDRGLPQPVAAPSTRLWQSTGQEDSGRKGFVLPPSHRGCQSIMVEYVAEKAALWSTRPQKERGAALQPSY